MRELGAIESKILSLTQAGQHFGQSSMIHIKEYQEQEVDSKI